MAFLEWIIIESLLKHTAQYCNYITENNLQLETLIPFRFSTIFDRVGLFALYLWAAIFGCILTLARRRDGTILW